MNTFIFIITKLGRTVLLLALALLMLSVGCGGGDKNDNPGSSGGGDGYDAEWCSIQQNGYTFYKNTVSSYENNIKEIEAGYYECMRMGASSCGRYNERTDINRELQPLRDQVQAFKSAMSQLQSTAREHGCSVN